MPRIDWVEARLQNWALWKTARGGGNLGCGGTDLGAANGGRSGYVTASIPIMEVEASATDDAVNRLVPAGTVLTVHKYYLGPGGHQDRALSLGISVAAMYARIEKAHHQLAELFIAQREERERRRLERERVEALQRRSFPR
jgi:hypothetical protein